MQFATLAEAQDAGYTLVDVREHPIRRITETGIELADGSRYEVDLIIFALGFHAFTAPLRRSISRRVMRESLGRLTA